MENALRIPVAPRVNLEPPEIFFTVHESRNPNPGSVAVVEAMKDYLPEGSSIKCIVFDSIDRVDIPSSDRAVGLFDGSPRNHFSPVMAHTSRIPPWMSKSRWGIELNARKVTCTQASITRCARTTLGQFVKRFNSELGNGNFPWGPPKRGTKGPSSIIRLDPATVETRLTALNSGPDLARAIAARDFAKELPVGSRISWLRVPTEPVGFSRTSLESVVQAMRAFEIASGKLVLEDPQVRATILAGVGIADERLEQVYVDPGVPCFSVARPDIHWAEDTLNVSENDEMPGGMPELVHIDAAYGVNAESWKNFFDWLTGEGPLVFLVSHEWSGVYVPETKWLVSHLQSLGYDARLLTTDQLDTFDITPQGVFLDGAKVGTVWRQFPIFETKGKLAELVLASRAGAVRLVPEFAHYGNKAWFHIFRTHAAWYDANMEPEQLALLRRVLPDSHLVEGEQSFPCEVGGMRFQSLADLKALSQEKRDQFVLKICGANNLAARSYGVLMGEGIKSDQWYEWVTARVGAQEPFLIQERFRTGVADIPVWNTARRTTELFGCRLLMRPWAYADGRIVSVHGCAVPKEYFKVHGMVAMAVMPVELV